MTDHIYYRGDQFAEDLSYLSDSSMADFVREQQTIFEIQRVLEDKDTGETLYYLQSVDGFETFLMTAKELREMEDNQENE